MTDAFYKLLEFAGQIPLGKVRDGRQNAKMISNFRLLLV